MIIRCIDFETSGLPTETDPHAVCEVGWCDVVVDDAGMVEVEEFPHDAIVNPGRKIDIEAMAVHHIRNQDVVNAPSPDKMFAKLMDGADMFAAHYMDFERKFFAGGDKPWVCTHKTSLRTWPDAPSHSNQGLRYYLELDDKVGFDRDLAHPPHRAGPDAYVTAHVLRAILAQQSAENVRSWIDTLVRWSAGPALLIKVGFGKHFGKRWSEVPVDYLEWIVEKSDIDDRDVRATAKYHLRLKAEAADTGNPYAGVRQ